MPRGDLTDPQWQQLQPRWPAPQGPSHGASRPPVDPAPWCPLAGLAGAPGLLVDRGQPLLPRAAPGDLGPALEDHPQRADATGPRAWMVPYVDRTPNRAHPHAMGARPKGGEGQALGRSRGGGGTKIPLRAEGGDQSLGFRLTPDPWPESQMFVPRMTRGAGKQPGCGRPRVRPPRVCRAKACNSRHLRVWRRWRGRRSTLPRRRTERPQSRFDQTLYRWRHQVERTLNRLQPCRHITTRWKKKAETCRALRHIGTIRLWL